MGIIKPIIIDFVEEDNSHYKKEKNKQEQQTLTGGSVVRIDIPKKIFSYIFKCSKDCPKRHKIMCEDWELLALYRNCEKYRKEGVYKTKKEVIEKVKQRFLYELPKKKDFYFMVGTHYRFNKYIIVSVIYPKKTDIY
jgi:hypothetical protein